MKRLEVPVLIVGGGGAGLSAAVIFSDLDIEYLLVERHSGTSPTPKAHYVNQRSMENFRQHGVAAAVYDAGAPRENMGKVHWMTSLSGSGPLDGVLFHEQDGLGGGGLIGQYDRASSAHPTNIPQSRLEPILARTAQERRADSILFGHELIALTQDDSGVTALVRDLEGAGDVEIRCQYLVAADAGKTIGPALHVEMLSPTGLAMDSVSVTFEADLSRYIHSDTAVMRIILHPSTIHRIGGLLTMGPTWTRHSEEWRVGFALSPEELDGLTEETVSEVIRDYLKIDDPIKITGIFRWHLETIVAERFLVGRVILVGDAAHQHPPGAGLGLNSGIQDVHNIGWKLALVLQGKAEPSLLETYEIERKPVVTRNAEWGLFSLTNRAKLIAAMGLAPGAPEGRNEAEFAKLMADTQDGASRRAVMREIFKVQRMEYAAHDMEMGFYYETGALVEDGSDPPWRDPMGSEYRQTSRPGSRLPHAWLEQAGQMVSTHDLIPMGGLLVLSDAEGGGAWSSAADTLSSELGVRLANVRVGPDGDAQDLDGTWATVREVDSDGVVVVRPDGHVGYRSVSHAGDPLAALRHAANVILGRTIT